MRLWVSRWVLGIALLAWHVALREARILWLQRLWIGVMLGTLGTTHSMLWWIIHVASLAATSTALRSHGLLTLVSTLTWRLRVSHLTTLAVAMLLRLYLCNLTLVWSSRWPITLILASMMTTRARLHDTWDADWCSCRIKVHQIVRVSVRILSHSSSLSSTHLLHLVHACLMLSLLS